MLHQIGSGVLGPVFRAYDSQNDRLAAIKTFKLMLVPEDAARFAERLRALVDTPPAHGAILRGVLAGLDRSTPFLALEYAPGESLDALLRQSGAWPIGRALPVLREIAAAIDAAWAAGTGHGALHPRDIFIAFGPTDVRVTGFGIGAALEAVGAKAPVRRPYSAPERGSERWDIRADVYSLGVVAFEMLSGQRPVGPDDEAPALVAELSADTRAAVRRVLAVAMAEAPADRYETATSFVGALEDVAGLKHKLDMPPAPPPVALVAATEFPDEDVDRPSSIVDRRSSGEAPEAEPEPVARVPAPPAETPMAEPPPLSPPAHEPVPALKVERPAKVEPAPALSMRPKVPAVEHPLDLPLTSNPRPERPRGPVPGGFLHAESESEPSSPFPWAAVAAVFIAGLVLSGVVMYQWGWSRGRTAGVQEAVKSATASPTPLNVASPEPSASPSATPTPAASARSGSVTRPGGPAASDGPPLVGRLVIQSVPAGALVTVDGRRRGETPVTLQVPLGRHEIQVARSGYVPATRRVELTKKSTAQTVRVQLQRGPGEPADGNRLPGSVSKAAANGSADVDSQPRGARVSVDGKFVGITPMRISDLAAGEHRFQFELAGYTAVTQTVNIVGGQSKPVSVRLVAGNALEMLLGAGR